jgi:hypothetical protein
MKEIFFITINPNRNNPRGIRVSNIVKNLQLLAPENNYSVLSFSNKLFTESVNCFKKNSFNLLFLLFRYTGIFKLVKNYSKISKILDPFLIVHFLIKWDLNFRLHKIQNYSKVIFVVVVSPFSSYLLVPWLKKTFPNSKIICDIGDPLFKNSARWNDDNISKEVEFEALKIAKNIIVTNELTKDHFIREFKINSSLIEIIPQGVDIELIDNKSTVSVVRKSKTMAYAGRFYNELRSPDALFTALANQDYWELHIYGDSPRKNVKNIFFHKTLEQESLFQRLSQYEILIFVDNKYGVQTSGKIFELLAFKKPILFIKGDLETITFNIAKKYKNVIFCDNNVDSIIQSFSQFDNLKNCDFQYDCHDFGWASRAEHYLKLF